MKKLYMALMCAVLLLVITGCESQPETETTEPAVVAVFDLEGQKVNLQFGMSEGEVREALGENPLRERVGMMLYRQEDQDVYYVFSNQNELSLVRYPIYPEKEDAIDEPGQEPVGEVQDGYEYDEDEYDYFFDDYYYDSDDTEYFYSGGVSGYSFEEYREMGIDYNQTYDKLKSSITETYGEPTQDEKIWYDERYENDESNFLKAFYYGHVDLQSRWTVGAGELFLHMNANEITLEYQ